MLVYPAVDIADGRCVRLLQGRMEDRKTYYESPVEAAVHWEQTGARALHLVDLDGALARGGQNARAVEEVLRRSALPVQVAGGLRDEAAVRRVLRSGAARAVVGTQAAKDPDWAVELCSRLPGRVVPAVDARDGRVAVEGWQKLTEVSPVELARRLAEGKPAAFLYTDVARDGMLTRPNFGAVSELLEAVDVPVIASGGVAEVGHIEELGRRGADAVVIGKALYEGRFSLAEALEAADGYESRLTPQPEGTP